MTFNVVMETQVQRSCLTNVIFYGKKSFQVKTSPIILASISFLVMTFFQFQTDLRVCV